MRKRAWSLVCAAACALSLLTGCAGQSAGSQDTAAQDAASQDTAGDADREESGGHEPITMVSTFRGMSQFADLVNEKYPEINLEIIPYSGANMTSYLCDELTTGNMPDIYVTTVYSPGQEDISDRLMDLSGYDFTNNYAEARLRDVADNGAIYLLPVYYNCVGITYNKTLLEEHGWTLPTTFAELEELAPKVKAAGCDLAVNQGVLPGYGFQYFCNILDTVYLNTLEGRKWQNDFLNGTATVKDTPAMMEALSTLEKWKEIGMLDSNIGQAGDADVKAKMAEGNTLFLLGSTNNITKEESEDEFGLMPYLSEDGTQNSYILNVSRYVGLNKQLEEEGNEQKLEDAVHVMEVMSTLEGMQALTTGTENTVLLPLQDYTIPESNYYKQIEDELNAGMTAPFIYAGWDNAIVPVGEAMLEYIRGELTLDDLAGAVDDSQHLLFDDDSITFTTATEKLDTDDCARLVGICFGKASGADLALVSENQWYKTDSGYGGLNADGVSGEMFPMPIKDQEIVAILPTGWRGNIETVTLSGRRIRELAETGYEREGLTFPYQMVTPEGMKLEDDATYTVAVCGVTDEVAAEGNLTDTGILGLDAMKEYLSQFETLSKDNLIWE